MRSPERLPGRARPDLRKASRKPHRANAERSPSAPAQTSLACQTPPEPSAGQQARSQIQQGTLAEKNEYGQGILYVKAPRPHLEQYDRLSVISVKIEPDEGDLPWNASTISRLRKSFLRTLNANLEPQSTWHMTEEEGPGVLGMRVSARELNVADGLPHFSASPSSRKRTHDKTTLVMELYDSATGEVLVQFIQPRSLPTQVVGGTRSRLDRLRAYYSYSRFADSMGDSLAELGRAVEAVRADVDIRPTR